MICVFMFGCGDDDDGNDNPFLNVADDLAGSAWVNSADSTDTLRFLLEPFEQTLDFMNPGAMVNTTRRIYNRCSYELYIEIIDDNHIDVDFVNKVVKSTYGYYLGTPPEDQVMDYDMNDELDKFTISGFTGSLESSYWEDITFNKIAE